MMSNWLKWEKGRQKSGYDKMLLLTSRWPIPFDLYLLQFPTGSQIKAHTDKPKSGEHHRMNIIIKRARAGGEFICENTIINHPRLKYFRPDIYEHAVTPVTKGTRYVLSFGWLRRR